MLRFDLLQDQWLILAIFGGAALTLILALSYFALWQPRKTDQEGTPAAACERGRVPWVIILVFAGMLAFSIGYLILRALEPPNW